MLYADLTDEDALRHVGVRPTRQRRAVLNILRQAEKHYMTADQTARLAADLRPAPRLATIYNVLNEFAKAGLLRRIDMGEKTVFCADPTRTVHYLDHQSGRLIESPTPGLSLPHPPPPPGWRIDGVDLFVRVSPQLASG